MTLPMNNYVFTCKARPSAPDDSAWVFLPMMRITGLEDDGSGTAHVQLSRAVVSQDDRLYSWFMDRDLRELVIFVDGAPDDVAVTIKDASPEKYGLSPLDAGANMKWIESLYICGNIAVGF